MKQIVYEKLLGPIQTETVTKSGRFATQKVTNVHNNTSNGKEYFLKICAK